MSEIRPELPSVSPAGREQDRTEEEVRQLIKEIAKDRTKAARLHRMDLNKLSPALRSALSEMLAQQLRGQIPPQLTAALNKGRADLLLLTQLVARLANSATTEANARAGTAATPEAARAAAANPELPQQALQWTQFVQSTTNVTGGGLQGRSGTGAPKGSGTMLQELIGANLTGLEGPGLRHPRLVAKVLENLTPAQRQLLMRATFGQELADKLQDIGISDPLMFVKAGALPSDRAQLAEALGMGRGRLLGLLMRAELLKIGPGRTGELAVRPEFLGPLRDAGIAMLASLAALRGLSFGELRRLYRRLRLSAGGFKKALLGSRVPAKRDLMHWARTAARRRSEILLANSEEYGRQWSRDDAMELIYAWYLEHLFWDALEEVKRREHQQQRQRHEEDERARQRWRDETQEEDEQTGWFDDDVAAELEYDEERSDHLMCFWITDPSIDAKDPGRRRMYVCVDPQTGAIIPQYIESEGYSPR